MTEHLTPAALAAIEARVAAATRGPWYSDSVRSIGAYGTGDDVHEGFSSYAVFDEKGRALCDAVNSDAVEVHEEWDEDGTHSAFDLVALRNMDLIANAPTDLAALLAHIRRLEAEREAEIAAAVARERERCAVIAERRHMYWQTHEHEVSCDMTACEDIAAAIREPKP